MTGCVPEPWNGKGSTGKGMLATECFDGEPLDCLIGTVDCEYRSGSLALQPVLWANSYVILVERLNVYDQPCMLSAGYFQSPSGTLSSDIKDATRGTNIQGFCCKGWKYCV